DALTAGLEGAAVRGLHDPGAAAGEDGVAGLGELVGEPPRRLVVGRALVHARRTEHGDGLVDAGELLEALHELAHDAEQPPGVLGQRVDHVLLLDVLHGPEVIRGARGAPVRPAPRRRPRSRHARSSTTVTPWPPS